jgi:SNF2 family DNA or RNA helicase
MMYVSKRTPNAKQIEALALLRGRQHFALLMAMRTRKTKVIVDDWGRMVHEGKCHDLLVIAPGGAYRPWADELRADLPDAILDDLKIFTWDSSRSHLVRHQREVDEFLYHHGPNHRPRVLLVNSEAVSSVKAARDLCVRFLGANSVGSLWDRTSMLVIDESVIIKNGQSVLGKFCYEDLSLRAHYRRILSGLPSPRSPLDLYWQFRFLSRTIFPEKFTDFRDRYATVKRICTLPNRVVREKLRVSVGYWPQMTDKAVLHRATILWPDKDHRDTDMLWLRYEVSAAHEGMTREESIDAIFRLGRYIQSIPIIEGYKNLNELAARIAPHSFRVRLEDCTDLPESNYSSREIEMTGEQRRLYTEMKELAVATLSAEKNVTATQVITQMLRLHQVLLGHVVDDDGETQYIKENRTDALVQLLRDYDGKAIIWCSYGDDVLKIAIALLDEFGPGSIACFWGGNRSTREAEEASFKESPLCRYMIATPDAGGRGRAWDVADLVIYYSNRDNLDHRSQSEERAKAVGKTRSVSYVDLLVPGTVEGKIIDALRNKMNLSDAVTGDDWKKWLV